jgi:hypothetical protein
MSNIGYYRYKLDNLTEGTTQIPLYKNGNIAITNTVIILPFCENDKLIKYLDKNGQYRFFAFNRYYEQKDDPKLLGKANKLITSILNSQSNKKNVGYKNERTISMVADDVTDAQLEYLSDLWTSPRVYLHLATDSSDEANDWLEVEIKGDNISRRRKNISGKITVDIILPEWFNITML